MANWKPNPKDIVRFETSDDRALRTRNEIINNARKREEDHKKWLQSPEGQAYVEGQRVLERMRKEDEQKRAEWNALVNATFKDHPKVGSVFKNVSIYLDKFDEKPAYNTRLLPMPVRYPEQPEWMMQHDKNGMRCFLIRISSDLVASKFPRAKEFSVIRVRSVRIVSYAANKKSAQIAVVDW